MLSSRRSHVHTQLVIDVVCLVFVDASNAKDADVMQRTCTRMQSGPFFQNLNI